MEALVEDVFVHSEETHLQLDLLVTKLFGNNSTNIFKKSFKNMYYDGTVAIRNHCDVRVNRWYLFLGSVHQEIGAEVDCCLPLHKWKHLRRRIAKCSSDKTETFRMS